MNRFTLIKRAFSSVNKCNCTGKHDAGRLSMVREMRRISWNPQGHKSQIELLKKHENEQWYKDAADFDDRAFKYLILSGMILGLGGFGYLKTNYYHDDDAIRFNMAFGAGIGGAVGMMGALAYPYPVAGILLVGVGATYSGGPTILRNIRRMIDESKKK